MFSFNVEFMQFNYTCFSLHCAFSNVDLKNFAENADRTHFKWLLYIIRGYYENFPHFSHCVNFLFGIQERFRERLQVNRLFRMICSISELHSNILHILLWKYLGASIVILFFAWGSCCCVCTWNLSMRQGTTFVLCVNFEWSHKVIGLHKVLKRVYHSRLLLKWYSTNKDERQWLYMTEMIVIKFISFSRCSKRSGPSQITIIKRVSMFFVHTL